MHLQTIIIEKWKEEKQKLNKIFRDHIKKQPIKVCI